jgi:hypothetical protein
LAPAIFLVSSLAPVALAGGKPKPERVAPRATPIVVHTADGFDWGDAAIGAAAGFGAALAAGGGITLARNR